MARDKDYVIELGATVHELFAAGHLDPSATEIAEAHFPGKVLGGEIIEGVRKRLGRIRDFLEENYPEFPVCLVSQTYYVRFRARTRTRRRSRPEKVESPEPSATCWRSPLGWTVLLTERQDGTGYAGEVRSPDGSRVTTTSWIDVPWLDEHLP